MHDEATETPESVTVHIKMINGEEFVCSLPCITFLTDGPEFATLDGKVCSVVYTMHPKTGARNMSLRPLVDEHPPNDPMPVYTDQVTINRSNIATVRVLSTLGTLYRYYAAKSIGLTVGRC